MMKKIGIIVLLIAIIAQGFSQEVSAGNNQTLKEKAVADTLEMGEYALGNDILIKRDSRESLNIRLGNRGITILESLEGKRPKIEFEKFDEDEPAFEYYHRDQEDQKRYRRGRFRGHWSGVEFGYNNYVTTDRSLSLPAEIDYMTLHSGKSNNFNINFSQLSLGLTRRIGFVTGLGMNWNNYRFDGNNNILKGSNGVIEVLEPAGTLEKSKFTSLYLTMPFMLEIQIPVDNNHINLGVGPIGAVKLASHTKMKYEGGNKVKSDSDLSLNMLRYGITARAGYENFNIYATSYLTPLFKAGKSPGGVELFPFEIGFAFTFND
jgi:hypothetical protein